MAHSPDWKSIGAAKMMAVAIFVCVLGLMGGLAGMLFQIEWAPTICLIFLSAIAVIIAVWDEGYSWRR